MTDNSTKIKHFCDNEINILSLVDSMTGKSTMIKRFCENRFEKRFLPTIGVDYGAKALSIQVGGEIVDVRVNFWNLSGDPDYAEVKNEIYEDKLKDIPISIYLTCYAEDEYKNLPLEEKNL